MCVQAVGARVSIAAPAVGRAPGSRLFSSPMDGADFDPAEREAAVAKIKELVTQNKVRVVSRFLGVASRRVWHPVVRAPKQAFALA